MIARALRGGSDSPTAFAIAFLIALALIIIPALAA